MEVNLEEGFDINKLCRICLCEKDSFWKTTEGIIFKIKKLCDIEFSSEDLICKLCEGEVNRCYNFSTKIINSYNELQKAIEGRKVKEEISDFESNHGLNPVKTEEVTVKEEIEEYLPEDDITPNDLIEYSTNPNVKIETGINLDVQVENSIIPNAQIVNNLDANSTNANTQILGLLILKPSLNMNKVGQVPLVPVASSSNQEISEIRENSGGEVKVDEMNSSDVEDLKKTPPKIRSAAAVAGENLLPAKSKERYFAAYSNFIEWKKSQETSESSISENCLIAYFEHLSMIKKPTTLWSIYSMLKATINLNDHVDIASFKRLVSLLKRINKGHVKKKAAVLTEKEVEQFLRDAPDRKYLIEKVALIFGLYGACRCEELVKLTCDNIKDYNDMLLIKITDTGNKVLRSFTIHGSCYKLVKQYRSLRPAQMTNGRFFVNYQKGKCTSQYVGRHKLAKMPSLIAKYLNLPNWREYTGHCFRRTSATIVDAGANLMTLQRYGEWQPGETAEVPEESEEDYEPPMKQKKGSFLQENMPSTSSQILTDEESMSP